MRFRSVLLATASALVAAASPIGNHHLTPRQATDYVGYLIATFSDANPTVQFWLSNGNDPSSYRFLNGGNEVLTSTVGTGAVRDIFLTHNSARSEWYLLATDLDVTAPGFSWDTATRRGSLGIVVWRSTDLVNWSSSSLRM